MGQLGMKDTSPKSGCSLGHDTILVAHQQGSLLKIGIMKRKEGRLLSGDVGRRIQNRRLGLFDKAFYFEVEVKVLRDYLSS